MGKSYLVTGGTDGIGKAIVKKILANSTVKKDKIVVVYGHSDEKARKLVEELNEDDRDKVYLIKFDMSSAENLDKLVELVLENTERIDYIISNIGIAEYAKFDDYTLDMWNHVVTTNLTVPTFLVQKLKNKLNRDGSVVLVGSYAGVRPYSSSVVYSISKAGLLFLAKVLVKELEEVGVRINAIAPGFIETGWHKSRSDESRERINRKIAVHRFGEPEEIADMTYSVMVNRYMNGSVVEIHGGYEYF